MFGVREKPSFPLFIFFLLRIYLNVYNSVKKIQSLPRPTVTVPPPHTPATVPHSARTKLSTHIVFLHSDSDTQTHHLRLRLWELYWVRRKIFSSSEFTPWRSSSLNCRDSCYCTVPPADDLQGRIRGVLIVRSFRCSRDQHIIIKVFLLELVTQT